MRFHLWRNESKMYSYSILKFDPIPFGFNEEDWSEGEQHALIELYDFGVEEKLIEDEDDARLPGDYSVSVHEYPVETQSGEMLISWRVGNRLQQFYFLLCFYRILIRFRAKRKILLAKQRRKMKGVFEELQCLPIDIENVITQYI